MYIRIVLMILLGLLVVNCGPSTKKSNYNNQKYSSSTKAYKKHGIYFQYPGNLTVQENKRIIDEKHGVYHYLINVTSDYALVQFNIINAKTNIKKLTRELFNTLKRKLGQGQFVLVKASEKRKDKLLALRHANLGYVKVEYWRKDGLFKGTKTGGQARVMVTTFLFKNQTYNFIVFMKRRNTFAQQVLTSFILLR